MSIDKSCDLKGQQKVFFLQLNRATSCCKSYEIELDATKKIDHYLEHWQQEKTQLQQGIEIESCEVCWKKERQGLLSERQHHTTQGADIELSLNNLCNHMCSYCSPKFSSVWQQSIEEQGKFVNVSKSVNDNQTVSLYTSTSTDYWLAEIKTYLSQQDDNSVLLKLLGGEPLMQIKNIQKFLEFNDKKIKKLLFTTNLNPPSNRFLVWILEHFPKEKLTFEISLDATVAYNAVPRAGFDQHIFNVNLALLEKHQVEFSFLSVVSILSIFDIGNFDQWLKKNQYKTIFSRVNNPDCLSPRHLPMEFKEKILNSAGYLPESIKTILYSPEEPTDLKLFEQYNYLSQYFSRSNIDPVNTANQLFGEYWNWLLKVQGNKSVDPR